MANCAEVHKAYDKLANGAVQIGELPAWMHIRGRVAYYVYQGPYSGLGAAFGTFMQKALASGKVQPVGPPGDVYVCDPADHEGPAEAKLTTILWAPLDR